MIGEKLVTGFIIPDGKAPKPFQFDYARNTRDTRALLHKIAKGEDATFSGVAIVVNGSAEFPIYRKYHIWGKIQHFVDRDLVIYYRKSETEEEPQRSDLIITKPVEPEMYASGDSIGKRVRVEFEAYITGMPLDDFTPMYLVVPADFYDKRVSQTGVPLPYHLRVHQDHIKILDN